MMKLIGIEWLKLKRLMTLKVILLVYMVLVPTMYILLSLLEVGPIRIPIEGYQFPDSYQLVAWTASWLNLMVGIIIIVFATNELKYKTQRQNVIDGLSKRDIIFSKFLVILGLTSFVTIYTFLVAFVIGLYNSSTGSPLDGIGFIGVYFISTMGYFSFAFFFANLVRLPALAIVIYIFSTIIEWIVGLIAVQEYVQFSPLTTFAQLCPFPMHFWVAEGRPNPLLMDTMERSILAMVYVAIFMISSYWIIKRRDV
ncbi:MAG: ABC-2 type transport system permease protein [Crocinitomicaceae bacterium]|jgi:ABC-2 type transport system permease protein